MKIASPEGTFTVWDLPTRLFHWLLVASISVAFLSSEEDSPMANWHILSGWTAAVLLVFRLVWGFAGGEHARFINFIHPSQAIGHLRSLASGRAERSVGHNPAGGMAVLLLIGTVAAVVASGWTSLQGGEEDVHEVVAWFLLGLVVAHVAAVIATSVLSRQNLVLAMVTGRKKRADHPGVRGVQSARPGALLVALAASCAAVAGIHRIDPAAFSLQQREGLESEDGAPGRGNAAAEHPESANEEGIRDAD